MKRNLKVGTNTYENADGIIIRDADTNAQVKFIDTSDATATAETIIEGETAYVNGELITGTYQKKEASSLDKLTEGTLIDIVAEATSIAAYACYNYAEIGSITATAATSVGNYAFYNCSALTTASISSTTSIGDYSFYGCNKLTEISMPLLTTVPSYAFYNCSAVTSCDFLDSVTSVGSYGMYNFGSGSSLAWNNTKDTAVSVAPYGLAYANFSKLSGKWNFTGSYASFYNTTLTEVDIECSSLPSCTFAYCSNITNFKLKNCSTIDVYACCSTSNASTSYVSYGLAGLTSFDVSESNITSIGNYAFGFAGYSRANPSTNRLVMDFSNSTFSAITDAFYRIRYADLVFPVTISTISSYAFYRSSNLNIYLPGNSQATLSDTSAFSSNTTSKVFVNYDKYNAYRTATNWSSSTILAYLHPYAPAGTFEANELLPILNNEGYAVTWYTDVALTESVTNMPEESTHLYCTVADEQTGYPISVTVANGTVTITDGIYIYEDGEAIPTGTEVIITLHPDTGCEYGEDISIAGEQYYTKDYLTDLTDMTYTVTIGEESLVVVAKFWDCQCAVTALTNNGTVLISNTEDPTITYELTDTIRKGTELTLTWQPNADALYGYDIQVNDEVLYAKDTTTEVSGLTYSLTMGDSLDLTVYFWDGEMPYDKTFANNTWHNIKRGIDEGYAYDYWLAGDTKTTTYNNTEYTIRIADVSTDGRYTKADGSGLTHYVFEFVELLAARSVNSSTKTYNGSSGYAAGGWATSNLRTYLYSGVGYTRLADDIKEVLSEITLTEYAYPGTSSSFLTATANSRLFIPAWYELTTNSNSYVAEYYSLYSDTKQNIWSYYASNTGAWKYYNGNYGSYWLRNPTIGSSDYWNFIYGNYNYNYFSPGYYSSARGSSYYVCAAFAI